MEERWHFVFMAKGWSLEEAFHYIGFGDHYDCLEGAIRTFIMEYSMDAEDGYTVFLKSNGKLRELFTIGPENARRHIKLVQHEV